MTDHEIIITTTPTSQPEAQISDTAEGSVVPANWPSDTSPEADAPPPTQRGPSGDETDESGETDEANV